MSDNKFILAVGGAAALAGGTLYTVVRDSHSINWWAAGVAGTWAVFGTLIVILFLSAKDVISERLREWEAWTPKIEGSVRPPKPSSGKTHVTAGALILLCVAVGGLMVYASPRKASIPAAPAFDPITPSQPPKQADVTAPKKDSGVGESSVLARTRIYKTKRDDPNDTSGKPGAPPEEVRKNACFVKESTYYNKSAELPGGADIKRPILDVDGADSGEEIETEYYQGGDQRHWILMKIALTNRGETSIAKEWGLCIDDGGVAVKLKAAPSPIPENVLGSGRTNLVERSLNAPIEHGQRVVGWIVFSLPTELALRLRENTKLLSGAIQCKDYLSKQSDQFIFGNDGFITVPTR